MSTLPVYRRLDRDRHRLWLLVGIAALSPLLVRVADPVGAVVCLLVTATLFGATWRRYRTTRGHAKDSWYAAQGELFNRVLAGARFSDDAQPEPAPVGAGAVAGTGLLGARRTYLATGRVRSRVHAELEQQARVLQWRITYRPGPARDHLDEELAWVTEAMRTIERQRGH